MMIFENLAYACIRIFRCMVLVLLIEHSFYHLVFVTSAYSHLALPTMDSILLSIYNLTGKSRIS